MSADTVSPARLPGELEAELEAISGAIGQQSAMTHLAGALKSQAPDSRCHPCGASQLLTAPSRCLDNHGTGHYRCRLSPTVARADTTRARDAALGVAVPADRQARRSTPTTCKSQATKRQVEAATDIEQHGEALSRADESARS